MTEEQKEPKYQYGYVHYGAYRVTLEAGYYTISDLEYILSNLKGINAEHKKSKDNMSKEDLIGWIAEMEAVIEALTKQRDEANK